MFLFPTIAQRLPGFDEAVGTTGTIGLLTYNEVMPTLGSQVIDCTNKPVRSAIGGCSSYTNGTNLAHCLKQFLEEVDGLLGLPGCREA